MIIERTTTIARPIATVFDFVSDPTRDPVWCPKVRSPRCIVWRDEDGQDSIEVTYQLVAAGEKTRFTQRDDARLGAPRILHPILRAGIGHDIAAQLERLRRHLEAS